ncbi:hypothetical protein EDEG_03438 [Edhazardia aedis USNM 41457]|uniref:Uncharacterized protein n=1 Tax=Edhazardia aedis (strain USNM 41457) TaxID=1003232 RepID=J9DHN6_EDHAE|nr:hypothetical protein EDEG_03438 [Edhazardia aedis USNM 41457]|eukprot:EJW02120.1 hypothetical protein EDEG_03438 [Edhazardia aedis USNM 41457]
MNLFNNFRIIYFFMKSYFSVFHFSILIFTLHILMCCTFCVNILCYPLIILFSIKSYIYYYYYYFSKNILMFKICLNFFFIKIKEYTIFLIIIYYLQLIEYIIYNILNIMNKKYIFFSKKIRTQKKINKMYDVLYFYNFFLLRTSRTTVEYFL